MDLRPLWLPIVHRYCPTPGPGGLASSLSLFIHADATRMVHVTRYLDVTEVWQRDDDFSVRGYDERMKATTGAFILGMNDLARYAPDAAVIHRVVRRDDASLIRRIVREETDRAMARVRRTGRVDIVKDLADVVPIRFVMRYFGLKVGEPEKVLRLLQRASWYIFSFWSDPGMRDAAIAASEELRPILSEVIARRRRDGDLGYDDVMGRMMLMTDGFADGDAGIARSIAGLCSGTLNAPIGLFANSVDKLVSLDPEVRRTVHALARSAASGSTADEETFRDVLLEAERFGVFPSVLYRYAERDATLAAGTTRAKKIPKGTTVVVWPTLAAFDPDVFDRPFDFVPGRPKWQYMGFGHGRHWCLGEHIGQILLQEMSRAVLGLSGLRRAPGKAGRIQTLKVEQANFPSSFVLEFDRES